MNHPDGRRREHRTRFVAYVIWIFGRLTCVLPPEFRREYDRLIVEDFACECRAAQTEAGIGGVIRIGIASARDLVAGAIAEHLSLIVRHWKEALPVPRYRTSLITIFCAYVAFVVAGIGLQKMTEYDDFHSVAQRQLTVGIPFAIVTYGGAISALAVLAGGVPVALAVLRQALTQRRWRIVGLFAVPPVALVLLVGFAVLFIRSFGRTGAAGANHIHVVAAAFFFAAALSTFAVSYAVAHTDLSTSLYRFARWPAVITTITMILICGSTIMVALSLNAVAPQILGDMVSYYMFSLLNVTILMTLATLIAGIGAASLLGRRRSRAALA